MSEDLIERLHISVRHMSESDFKFTERLLSERREAANEIERLRARLAEAEKVIEPFVARFNQVTASELNGAAINIGYAPLLAAAEWMEQSL